MKLPHVVSSDPILTVHLTLIHPDARIPQYESDDAAAFDLASVADVTVEPGRVALVPTGLVIQVPVFPNGTGYRSKNIRQPLVFRLQ